MRLEVSQRRGKGFGKTGAIAAFALIGCYQRTPYPECWVYSPECDYGTSSSGGTASMPTSEPFPAGSSSTGGVEDNSSGGATASEGEGGTGMTTGPEEQAPPEILGMSLTPGPGTPGSCVLKSAGPVTVLVQTEDAVEVWIAVDDGEAVALAAAGDDGEFVGEIAVLGESWNGSHTVSAVAKSGELVSAPWVDMFSVAAPEAGSEAWKKKSAITPSKGNAVAVDAQGEVYELFTEWIPKGARCHVRRRDPQGEPAWPQDTVPLPVGGTCGGEDIEVAPDGTVWVLVNTFVDEVNRWHLFHLDREGVLLDTPQVGDFQESGRGLDVNAAGDLLLCGERPALMGQDAWVRWLPPVGDGWTVPWVYEVGNNPFEERTKDCAFIEDRIVVVGEVFGLHEKNELPSSRGFVVEFGVNGAALSEVVATASPAWQSGYEAVASDGSGYTAVGYTCGAKVTPCTPTVGAIHWFSLGGAPVGEQAITKALTLWDVAASPTGEVIVAAQASKMQQGLLVQAWNPGVGDPMWAYQGAPSTLQMATGLALNLYGSIYVGGYYLDGDVLAAGVVKLHAN
jgi:hypothetical protein